MWKVTGEAKGQATLEGNHDNPVSNTHQADTYQWRKTSKGVGVGVGAKTAKATVGKDNVSKIICKSAVKLLKPC